MTYARFEDIPAWQEAMRLAEGVYDMTEGKGWPGSRSLQDQLERAALSVSNNISEGFERGTTNGLLAFIYIARGSAGEVRSMLCFLERRPLFSNFKSQISNLKSIAEDGDPWRLRPKDPAAILKSSMLPFSGRSPMSSTRSGNRWPVRRIA
jgi:four helix bundle protein